MPSIKGNMSFDKIDSIESLYQSLDRLYQNIYKYCRLCREEDCKGYVWLLPEEVEKLNEKIDVVEINNKAYFLDSFVREKGKINVEVQKPTCVFFQKERKCAIYPFRPFVCRLYPIDFRILNKTFYIVVHTDCFFIKKLIEEKEISSFLEKAFKLFYNCNQKLINRIINQYRYVNKISKYPKDYKHDDYFKFLKVVKYKEKIKFKICQSAKRFLIQKR